MKQCQTCQYLSVALILHSWLRKKLSRHRIWEKVVSMILGSRLRFSCNITLGRLTIPLNTWPMHMLNITNVNWDKGLMMMMMTMKRELVLLIHYLLLAFSRHVYNRLHSWLSDCMPLTTLLLSIVFSLTAFSCFIFCCAVMLSWHSFYLKYPAELGSSLIVDSSLWLLKEWKDTLFSKFLLTL